jgi:hypothetical protein
MAKEDWKQIDKQALINAVGDTWAADIWEMYEASKAAYRAYKVQRDVFENAMQASFAAKLPAGYELKFGYNFGKLSIAVGPVTERKAQPKADSQELGEWLTEQANAGHRC